MSREEFLAGLEEALAGEVPASVIRENLNYYQFLHFPGDGKGPYCG